jgi:hypothetical protein
MKSSVVLEITTDKSATQARIWISNSKSKDFRQSPWTSKPMHEKAIAVSATKENYHTAKRFEIEIRNPLAGFKTVFGEIKFVQDNCTFLLSTQTNLISTK